MSAPEYHNLEDNHHQYDPIDHWTCLRCFKHISATRPPVFNADNCSCVEVGTTGAENRQPYISEEEVYVCDSPNFSPYRHHNPQHIAQSYASSSISVQCPEGPEREVPDANLASTYLAVGAENGLNKTEHRRFASYRSNMSYAMKMFLAEKENKLPGYSGPPSETGFLPQDIHIQSQTSSKVRKRTKRSKPSFESTHSSGCGDSSFVGWGVDPVAQAGSWADEEGARYCGDGYPMAVSGLSENAFKG